MHGAKRHASMAKRHAARTATRLLGGFGGMLPRDRDFNHRYDVFTHILLKLLSKKYF